MIIFKLLFQYRLNKQDNMLTDVFVGIFFKPRRKPGHIISLASKVYAKLSLPRPALQAHTVCISLLWGH